MTALVAMPRGIAIFYAKARRFAPRQLLSGAEERMQGEVMIISSILVTVVGLWCFGFLVRLVVESLYPRKGSFWDRLGAFCMLLSILSVCCGVSLTTSATAFEARTATGGAGDFLASGLKLLGGAGTSLIWLLGFLMVRGSDDDSSGHGGRRERRRWQMPPWMRKLWPTPSHARTS